MYKIYLFVDTKIIRFEAYEGGGGQEFFGLPQGVGQKISHPQGGGSEMYYVEFTSLGGSKKIPHVG